MGGRLAAIVIASAAAVGLIAAPAAEASFHLIKVREVFPGTGAEDGFVELQMYAGGQNLVNGHKLTIYDSAGALRHTSTFSANVASGENQRTVLIGDSNVAGLLGVAPDLVDPNLAIPASGGAACWNAGGVPADCVAWGNFSGAGPLGSATGTSAGAPVAPAGLAAGEAILRTIEPGCPTLLEEGDDSDDSASDFTVLPSSPNPRNNAMAPTERTCAGAPQTAIDERPAAHSNSAAALFTYDAPTATRYECRLDGAAFAPCGPGEETYAGLAEGIHSFQVRGVNAAGPDPTPAAYSWTVDTVAPTAFLDTGPVDHGPGASAAFEFHASESATFECSLVRAGQPDSFAPCAPATTFTGLADGRYLFKVRATDVATNVGQPVSFEWEVDNRVADTTPPETTILAKPADPSDSSTASFAYGSNEPGSSFECRLDAAAFAPCPTTGVSYTGLADGPHSFQVRATDPSGNTDPTPAGYSFSVSARRPTGSEGTAPQTRLLARPGAVTHDRTPSFRFGSDVAGARFECAVDGAAFHPCRSPFTTRRLRPGRHRFRVRAVSAAGADRTPAQSMFEIQRRH